MYSHLAISIAQNHIEARGAKFIADALLVNKTLTALTLGIIALYNRRRE